MSRLHPLPENESNSHYEKSVNGTSDLSVRDERPTIASDLSAARSKKQEAVSKLQVAVSSLQGAGSRRPETVSAQRMNAPNGLLAAWAKRHAPRKRVKGWQAVTQLAREVEGWEISCGKQLDLQQCVTLFNAWFEEAQQYMEKTASKEMMMCKFLDQKQKVKKPIGSDELIEKVRRMWTSALPDIPGLEDANDLRRVAALARERALRSADGRFPLSYRDVANFIPDGNHRNSGSVLNALVMFGVLRKVSDGVAGKKGGIAAQWEYLLPLGCASGDTSERPSFDNEAPTDW